MDDRTLNAGPLVIGIRFRPGGPIYDFDPGALELVLDDRVLVESELGPALATVVTAPRRRPTTRILNRIIKKADERDLQREDETLQRKREQQHTAYEILKGHGFPLKLVKVETALDGSRVVVFVTTEAKNVDYREVARALAGAFSLRIEVKQLGARDEARQAGGLGVCGRELCCSSWLREFQAVSVKMVKAQGMSLSPSKLAGQCGRLKCCLRYEYQTYQDLRKGLPKVGSQVESVVGAGKVVGHNVLKRTVLIRRAEDGVQVEATLEDLVVRRPDA
jgi:cell fate regulator YaaT (PSP1 superfamily)